MHRPFTTLAVVLAALVLAAPAYAQAPANAALVVVVFDSTGAVVADATVSIVDTNTGATRETTSGADGSATFAALSVAGSYNITVTKTGFAPQTINAISIRSGETAKVRVDLKLGAARADVTVYGTSQGVRADPQIGRTLEPSQIDETPILGRKVTSLPLLNSAFRPAKGTGDIYLNSTFVVTGAGGRRETTVTLDGASDDEPWGRQAPIITLPMGAVQEMAALTNAFSAEYGWTAGPAVNIITKSGSNDWHGEGLFMGRPGGWEATSFSTRHFCPPSVSSCTTPSTLTAIKPADIPDALAQVSGSIGGTLVRNKTFLFAADDYTWQNRTSPLSSSLPAFVLPSDGSLSYVGEYRQELLDLRVDHKFTPTQTLTVRVNLDRFSDTNPQDTVGGTSAPTVARQFSRHGWSAQLNHTSILGPQLLNEARLSYLNDDPVGHWEPLELSTTYTRSGSVPFTIGQSRSSNLYSRLAQVSDAMTWSRGRQTIRFGGSAARHTSGGFGAEFGTAILGTFTFKSTTTAPFDQLTLNDVQQYSQPISYGITNYHLAQWLLAGYAQDDVRIRDDLTINAGLRYDRQTLTTATKNFEPRVGFGWHPTGDARTVVRGGYGMYYTQIRSNVVAAALYSGLDGLASYTAVPGQLGFPTCLTAPCVPLQFDPRTLPASQLPARDITIEPGKRSFYESQFAQYGLNFDLLQNYPDQLLNPRSQVITIGAEREIGSGFFIGSDYVHQHWSNIDRTVDLNAPTPFGRTAQGQTRTVTAANATRPILPVNGGVRQVNALINLGVADYDGWTTEVSYRGDPKTHLAISYTLSKATNTTEPDGNGINPNESNISALGEQERGPSVLDQRHRVVINFSRQLPYSLTAGTFIQLASARPFSATTGVDNNGDGANNDRPVINGVVVGKSSFRSTATQEVALFIEGRIKTGHGAVVLRLEGFNLFNNVNVLGRGQTVYGNTDTPNSTFGQLVAVGASDTNALPSLANIDPPRMFQVQLRYVF
jgi:hypothetical protein